MYSIVKIAEFMRTLERQAKEVQLTGGRLIHKVDNSPQRLVVALYEDERINTGLCFLSSSYGLYFGRSRTEDSWHPNDPLRKKDLTCFRPDRSKLPVEMDRLRPSNSSSF